MDKEQVNKMCPTAEQNALGDKINEVDGRVAVNQADSTASDVVGLVSDFNDLLTKLKDAGLMETS